MAAGPPTAGGGRHGQKASFAARVSSGLADAGPGGGQYGMA